MIWVVTSRPRRMATGPGACLASRGQNQAVPAVVSTASAMRVPRNGQPSSVTRSPFGCVRVTNGHGQPICSEEQVNSCMFNLKLAYAPGEMLLDMETVQPGQGLLGLGHHTLDELRAAGQIVDQADHLARCHHAEVGPAVDHRGLEPPL